MDTVFRVAMDVTAQIRLVAGDKIGCARALFQKGATAGFAAFVRIAATDIDFGPAAAAAAVIRTAFYITV